MEISIVCSSGSPIGLIPPDIDGRGVGGAELALMTTAEQFGKEHKVRVFNNPKVPGKYGNVDYLPVGDWNKRLGDVLIVFRTPFHGVQNFKGKKIFWSCDQFTTGNFNTDVFPYVDKIVTISDFHTSDFVRRYGIDEERCTTIPIGVRTWEYEQDVEKVRNRVIFCSVPDRGLHILRQVWSNIVQNFPDLSLVVTSDYRLWGSPDPRNEQFRRMWQGVPNVEFMGKIPRRDMVIEQMKAEWMLYPCCYDELFCIAAAECQVAGAVPVTSTAGALRTTNAYGVQVEGNVLSPEWVSHYTDFARATINVRDKIITTQQLKEVSRQTFGFEFVMEMWKEVLE